MKCHESLFPSYLFVGEHEKNCISKFVFVQHPTQLFSCFTNSLAIIAIHYED